MQIKNPGWFGRGQIILPPSPHITPESLLAEMQGIWGSQGCEVYKTALIGADLVLKRSGWTGIALKIKQQGTQTTILWNVFSPSVFVRLLAMGLIPIMILKAGAWGRMTNDFRAYAERSPLMNGQMGGQQQYGQMGGYGQAPQLQQAQGYPQGQYPQPQGQYPQQQAQYPQQQQAQYPQQQQQAQYPQQQQQGQYPQQPPAGPGGYPPQGGGWPGQ